MGVHGEAAECVAHSPPMPLRRLRLDRPLDLERTLWWTRRGHGDPTMRLSPGRAWLATRTGDGPASLALALTGDELVAEAWGPGADRILADLPRRFGLDEDPVAVVPAHPVIADLVRRYRGVGVTRSAAVLESLVPAILEQKVTGDEARRGFRGLVRAHGEAAPGPAELGLRLPPRPATLAGLPYEAYHPFGIERRRAELIRRVAGRAPWFEATVDLPLPEAHARLTALPGLGAWTAAEVATRALGDRDAVSVGDYHLPNLVTWLLVREPRGDDARMLELLEPYRGYRALVVRLLETSGLRAPRYGPRLQPRRIEGI
jgi:3-methyladenine DNA glycosylase/8-oxoguanine DNA glycosylase